MGGTKKDCPETGGGSCCEEGSVINEEVDGPLEWHTLSRRRQPFKGYKAHARAGPFV